MVLIWAMTAAAWAGHLGLLFIPDSALGLLLTGPIPMWVLISLSAALLPQLVIVPWSWIDSGRRDLATGQRVAWRLAIFFTGFLAVTLYALKFRSPAASSPRRL